MEVARIRRGLESFPDDGALQLDTQSSYLTQAPWSVAIGAPKKAHTSMGYLDIRYVLP